MLDTVATFYGPLVFIHVACVFVTLILVVTADIYGLRWVIGNKHTLNARILKLLHRVIWTGLVLTTLAGAAIALPYFDYLITTTAFQIKLLLVFFLNVNAFVISHHLSIAATTSFIGVPKREKWFLFISGAVSVIGWIGSLIAAQFLSL